MRLSQRILLFLALLPLAFAPSFGLELREGVVKIAIDESTARISVFRLIDVAKDRYEALLFDEDPRTSHLTLAFEGRQYKLGDSSDFRQSIARSEKGATIEFKSSFARVTETLVFTRSSGAAIADGVRITIGAENLSQKDASMGLRLLLDTYLGEKSGIHFRTPSREKMANEAVQEGGSMEAWAASPGETSTFMVQFLGEGIDKPDRVHFANWKRINDSPWTLDASTARSFSLLPYSVNDSALALYWQPRLLPKGSALTVATVLGSFNEKGYPLASSDSGTDALFSKTVLTQQGQGDLNSLLSSDLLSVRDLLSRIDLVLSTGKAPGSDEIAAWRKILDLLEERKKGY